LDWNEKKINKKASVLGECLREAALRGDLMGFHKDMSLNVLRLHNI
jgi:hypothetical protein